MTDTITATVTKIGKDTFTVPSRTTAGHLHVIRRVNGYMSCSCEAGFNGRECWHVRAVRAYMLTESITPKSDADAKRRDLGLFLITGGRQGSAA